MGHYSANYAHSCLQKITPFQLFTAHAKPGKSTAGTATFSKMTFSIMTHSIMPFSIMTLSIMTFSIKMNQMLHSAK